MRRLLLSATLERFAEHGLLDIVESSLRSITSRVAEQRQGLLMGYSAVNGDGDAAGVASRYLALMAPLEKERLYMRGGGFAGVELTDEGRASLEQLDALVKEARRAVSRSTSYAEARTRERTGSKA